MDLRLKSVISQYDFNLSYAFKLVEDLHDHQMTLSPARGLENHPAFTLGHLVSGSALMAEDLGGTMELPVGWRELFLRKGPGDPRLPEPDRSLYPPKELLLHELEHQHLKVKSLLVLKSVSDLDQKIKWRFSEYMPSLLDLTIFMCISHEAMHLGQLAAWRRAMGLPSALAAL